jgi:uncharacterized membrane protein YccC
MIVMDNNLSDNLKMLAYCGGIVIGITLASVIFINTHTIIDKFFRLLILIVICFFMFLNIRKLLK